MLERLQYPIACSLLSLCNVIGFFCAARFAEAMGFVGADGVASFAVSIGLLTMLLTMALLAWSAIDHFMIEATSHSTFNVALNMGFLFAFMAN